VSIGFIRLVVRQLIGCLGREAMSLLDALLDDSLGNTVASPCRVTIIAEGLEEPYLGAFLRLVNTNYADGGVAPAVAAAKAARAGIRVSETTIGRHRRGLCGCERQVTE
jgi:hypothetical protein